jgi:hypothetical protein
MLIGRFFLFKCDFCNKEFEQKGYGLPDGMKYIPSNVTTNEKIRHMCHDCIKLHEDKIKFTDTENCILFNE